MLAVMKGARPLCCALLVVVTACGGRVLERTESAAAGSDGSGGSSATAPAESAPAGSGGTSSSAGAAPSTATPQPEPNGGSPAPDPSGAGTGASASNGDGTTGNGTTASNSGTEVPVPDDYPDLDSRTHYMLAGLTDEGLVLAAYWTGSVEAAALVDPGTGARTDVGTLGDLYLWSGQFIYDDRTRMAYAVGENAAQQGYLYSFSLDDRETTQAALTELSFDNIVLGGVTRDGSIVAAAGLPATLVEIDPTTGESKPVGTIEGMTNWDGNLVYDDATRVVYALGQAGGIDKNYLFTTQLDAQKTSQRLLPGLETAPIYYTTAGLDPHGQLVAAYWDGVQEAIVTLDPTDASSEAVGSLGDLTNWDNRLVYNPSLQSVVAFGWSASNVGHLYETDIGR